MSAARFLERESTIEIEGRDIYLPNVQGELAKKVKARLHGAGIISKRFFLPSLRDFHLDFLRYASPFIVSRDVDSRCGFLHQESNNREANTLRYTTRQSARYSIDTLKIFVR